MIKRVFSAHFIEKVQKGLHEFLFKLLILRYLMDSEGKMWKCSDKQLYIIEILQPADAPPRNAARKVRIFTKCAMTFVRHYYVFAYIMFSICCPHRLKLPTAHS